MASLLHYSLLLLALAAVHATAAARSEPPLRFSYCARSCPHDKDIVRRRAALDRSVLSAMIRLHFHDCFVRVRAKRTTQTMSKALVALFSDAS
jgi:hypothetical protein